MRLRSLIASMIAAALLSGLTVAVSAAPAAAANTTVCNIYCDARDRALAPSTRVGATATVWSRAITLYFDDADDMAWASITNGSPPTRSGWTAPSTAGRLSPPATNSATPRSRPATPVGGP